MVSTSDRNISRKHFGSFTISINRLPRNSRRRRSFLSGVTNTFLSLPQRELHNSRLPPTCHQSACHKFRQSLFKMKYHQFGKWLHKKKTQNNKHQPSSWVAVFHLHTFSSRLGLFEGSLIYLTALVCFLRGDWLLWFCRVFLCWDASTFPSAFPGVSLIPPLLCCDLMVCVCVCWRVCFPVLTDALSERPSWVYSSLWMRV